MEVKEKDAQLDDRYTQFQRLLTELQKKAFEFSRQEIYLSYYCRCVQVAFQWLCLIVISSMLPCIVFFILITKLVGI